MTMKLTFSQHALQRLRERGLSRKEVIHAVRRPDKIGRKGSTWVAAKLRRNNHVLIIVYTETDSLHIITVIDTSKVDKYL